MSHPLPATVEASVPLDLTAVRADAAFIELWLCRHESPRTRANYQHHIGLFLAHVAGKRLEVVTLGDLQGYLALQVAWAPATRALATATIKSLFSFAHDLGYVRFNVGRAVKIPSVKNTLAERIMAEPDTLRMVALEPSLRNRALLTLTYGAGLRISELCALCWKDLTARDGGEAGQVTIFGKGGKTRAVLLSPNTWRTVNALRSETAPDAPVFLSREGGALDRSQVHRIVKAAAARAGLSSDVSAHWLRHAHASHSLERGAPLHLVQATLGHATIATTGRYLHARPSDSSARYLGI